MMVFISQRVPLRSLLEQAVRFTRLVSPALRDEGFGQHEDLTHSLTVKCEILIAHDQEV